MRSFHSLLGFLLVPFLVFGCSPSEDPKVSTFRRNFIIASEPGKSVSLTEAKALLTEEADIILFGRVGSGKLDPFEKRKASFVLSEAPAGDHENDNEHDASECPFCKRRAAEAPIASIEFLDESGKPIAISADKLLGLKIGQTVVIQGRGIYVPDLDTLQINASKLFVRTGG